MSAAQLESKAKLLEEYVQTLERQNFAKNNETTLLYNHLNSIQQENDMLKSCIEALKQREKNERQKSQQQGFFGDFMPITSSRNFDAELRASVNMDAMKNVADEIRYELEVKEQELTQKIQENNQLKETVANLRGQLSQAAEKFIKSQQKIRKHLQEIKKLEEQNYNVRNSRRQNKGISFARLEAEKLVKQNNELIQRIRVLEKQKNNYYTQLRTASPLKARQVHENNPKNMMQLSRKKASGMKMDRWNLMEQKIRAIRDENQQLKANLAIQ